MPVRPTFLYQGTFYHYEVQFTVLGGGYLILFANILSNHVSYINILLLILFLIFVIEEQLDFPVLYASAKEGWASTTFTKDPPADIRNMSQLLDAIIRYVPPPAADLDAPFRMMVGIYVFLLKVVLTYRVLMCVRAVNYVLINMSC